VVGISAFLVILVLALGSCLYFYGGMKQYVRAVVVIKRMPVEGQKVAWDEFSGTDPRGAQRGILAGSWMGKVWVWSTKGLKSYEVDEYTVYSLFNGCSDEVRAKLNRGEKNAIQKGIYRDFTMWQKQAKVGDYVAVYTAKPENGGVEGNLREIYDYNFWLFMHTGIDLECTK